MARILVIDDDVNLRESVVALMRRRGHETAEAGNGRAGIDALSDFPADLVITDINMPEMDGIEVIAGLHESRPELPVIAISGGGRMDKEFLLDDAALFGAFRTLTKPFELTDLLNAVDAALEAGGAG